MVIGNEKRWNRSFHYYKYLTRNVPNSTRLTMSYYHVAITKKTGKDPYVFVFNLSEERIEREIVAPIRQQKPFMCHNSMIYPTDIENIVISKTAEPARQVLGKSRISRAARKVGRVLISTPADDNIDEWAVIRAGKDVTTDLIRELYATEEIPQLSESKSEPRTKPEVSKAELKNYLEEFLKLYRTEVKRIYPACFNEFPFCSSVRAIGVISLHYVYIFFTRDGNPKQTTIEVYDENDFPELLRVKDFISMKEQDILAILGVKNYIPDLVRCFWNEHHSGLRLSFIGPSISKSVNDSIKNQYEHCVDTGRDLTYVISGEYKSPVISKYAFLCNTMDDTALSNRIREIIEKTEDGEVLVAGWVDSTGMRLLSSLTKRNVKFRIITHRPSDIEKRQSPSDTSEIFSKLAKDYVENVRVLPQLHTRLLISDKEALVSTADLTKESLGVKYEAGISTTDGLAIIKMKEFFEKLWEASTKLSTSKIKGEKDTK